MPSNHTPDFDRRTFLKRAAVVSGGIAVVHTGLVGLDLAPALASPGPSGTIKVLQFNIAGRFIHEGALDVADEVAGRIADELPLIVTLNEVCSQQALQVKTELNDAYGLTYQMMHDTTVLTVPDEKGCPSYGNAILWRGTDPGVVDQSFLTKDAGTEQRKIMGVQVTFLAHPTHICVTHLNNTSPNDLRERQALQVHQYVQFWRQQGNHVIIGGDFNAEPTSDDLDPVFASAYGGDATGVCKEVIGSRPSSPTATTDSGAALDYVFLTDSYIEGGRVIYTTTWSDHHEYFGYVDY